MVEKKFVKWVFLGVVEFLVRFFFNKVLINKFLLILLRFKMIILVVKFVGYCESWLEEVRK